MTSEFCPRCNAIRNSVMSDSARIIVQPDGKKKFTRARLFHCEICNSFIRSEDVCVDLCEFVANKIINSI